ncbi:TldD/PmbA family protein [Magnetovibrio blakemorei]|uniref:Modulator protein n=1 Tax=Magnetovibrio blakemorei TaxID=28181 RepID=A0A1E5Q915_9PROT|nr:metallopeptidase TldD-related protein [Magnetovibrio blakemorei]OEJ67538.1 modulator protein [Magnetovibrio blakemorei]
MPDTIQDKLNLLQDLIKRAQAQGADAADAVFAQGTSLSLSWRKGEVEQLERSEGQDLGLRVFVGKSQAIVSSSDIGKTALDELVERAVAMAKMVPADPYAGLADPDQLATEFLDFDMFDPSQPSAEELTESARVAEEAGLEVSGVSNSEGASAGFSQSSIAFAASNGFAHTYQRSRHSLSASMLAGEGTGMERDYDYTGAVWAEDLQGAAAIGRSAGERAVRRLNPKKAKTQQVPVVFDHRAARSLVGHLSSAINGSSIARGTSFLKDKMGADIFAPSITIVDDPHRMRGLRSAAFDDEGIATQRRNIIDQGKLTTWLLDLRSARQLGLHSTGHAGRGVSSPPSPGASNLYLQAGELSVADLIKDIKAGFLVTELIGMGVSTVTGDYSRGASGFWIEDGEIAHAVSEVTVAGHLKDMFMSMTPANDLKFLYGVDAPTVRIEGMTLAGA